MVSMNTSGQNGEGSGLVVSSGTAAGNNSIESGPSRSGLTSGTTSVVECNNNKNNGNNVNRICNINDSTNWKTLQQDPSKMSKLREIVENSTSASSKCVVDSILAQVTQLSDVEKLLLYLKLPVGRSPELDPLKQPLNPLGSRSEIQLTITWMKTHLEVDSEVSLPKEEVYNEYMHYCTNNGFKPLSTADFGKVMKQVYPSVRPRRLGHRGASKYCHAGLRKNYVLDVPSLPDLSENSSNYNNLSAKNMYGLDVSCDEVQKASLSVVMEWAEKVCDIEFKTFRDLALYLLEKNYVDNRSVSAFTLLPMDQTPGSTMGKHRKTQFQLQKKLQENEQIREQKRKLQEQQSSVSRLCSERPKTRRRSGATKNVSAGPESSCPNSRSSGTTGSGGNGSFGSTKSFVAGINSSETKGLLTRNGKVDSERKEKTLVDGTSGLEGEEKPNLNLNTLPNPIKQEDSSRLSFPSLYIGSEEKSNENKVSNNKNAVGSSSSSSSSSSNSSSSSSNNSSSNSIDKYSSTEKFNSKFIRANSVDDPTQSSNALAKGICNGNTVPKTYYMLANLPTNSGLGNQGTGNKNRYKPIQPKVGQCDISNNNNNSNSNSNSNITNNNNTNNNNNNNNGKINCNNVNSNSIGNNNNKFNSSNNSQWTDTSTILDNGKTQLEAGPGPPPPCTVMDQIQPNQLLFSQACADQNEFMSNYANSELDDPQKSTKLSELRKLLQNLPGVSSSTGITPVPLEIPGDQSVELDHDCINSTSMHRKVSFQTSVDGSESGVTNPLFTQNISQSQQGPEMYNKTYNFTPIVNNPYGGMSQGVSQASSANASPFMSPRNTPLPRSRHNSGQTNSTYVTPRSTPYTPDMVVQGGVPSENGTPFMSPAPTPIFPRSRHNSSQNLRTSYTPTGRSRHSSGAPSYRHTPYADDIGGRRNKYRHSSGSIPPSPQSPTSPLIHDTNSHPSSEALLFHQQITSNPGQNLMLKHPQTAIGTSNDMRRRHMSAGPSIPYQHQSQQLPANFNISNAGMNNDLLSQEVSNVMNNPQIGVHTSTGNTNRPQSVPLPNMLNTSCADMDYLAKSYPNTPLVNQQFQFGQEFSVSHPSSYAPTPVPSECNDFGEYSSIEFDPVLTGDTAGTNTALDSINATFSGFTSHPEFASAIPDSLSGVPSNVSGLIESSYVDVGNGRFAPCEETISTMQNAIESSCSNILSYHMTKESAQQNNRNAFLCAKGDSQTPPNGQTLMLNGNSQITLNELNAQSVLNVSESSFDPPSSHLEDFQPTLDDLGDPEVLDSLVLDVNKN